MRFLLDQNVSPVLVGLLAEAGHSAEHLRDLGFVGRHSLWARWGGLVTLGVGTGGVA